MASIVQGLVNVQLSNAAAGLYTAPTGTWVQLTKVLLANSTSGATTVTLYLVPRGQVVGATFITTNAQAVLGNQSWNSPNEYGLVLNPGDELQGFAATGSVINIMVAGAIFT